MTLGLTAKVVALHESLVEADLDHAFGGALALAFCTAEPRGTKDIDLNVFAGVDRLDDVLAALPDGVEARRDAVAQLRREAQARLWWDTTPVDLFLANHPFHDQVAANRRIVPFAGVDLPVLSCPDLAVFKAFFARPKDVVDIASMVAIGSVDLGHLESAIEMLVGDERRAFLARVREATAEIVSGT
jgi:hypothetical protein